MSTVNSEKHYLPCVRCVLVGANSQPQSFAAGFTANQ